MDDKVKEYKNNQNIAECRACKQMIRLCFTGKKWKLTCDTEGCCFHDIYGKTPEEVLRKAQLTAIEGGA